MEYFNAFLSLPVSASESGEKALPTSLVADKARLNCNILLTRHRLRFLARPIELLQRVCQVHT